MLDQSFDHSLDEKVIDHRNSIPMARQYQSYSYKYKKFHIFISKYQMRFNLIKMLLF
jgi:hypothetical protein